MAESDDSLREHIVAVLSDAGYEVTTDYRGGMKAVVAFNPDIVVLGADPPQLDCCDLLSEIKGSEHTHNICVVMLSPDVSWVMISLPFCDGLMTDADRFHLDVR